MPDRTSVSINRRPCIDWHQDAHSTRTRVPYPGACRRAGWRARDTHASRVSEIILCDDAELMQSAAALEEAASASVDSQVDVDGAVRSSIDWSLIVLRNQGELRSVALSRNESRS
jgi:hypothetical protein